MARRPFAPTVLLALVALSCLLLAPRAVPAAGPDGQLTWAVHVSLAPEPRLAPGSRHAFAPSRRR